MEERRKRGPRKGNAFERRISPNYYKERPDEQEPEYFILAKNNDREVMFGPFKNLKIAIEWQHRNLFDFKRAPGGKGKKLYRILQQPLKDEIIYYDNSGTGSSTQKGF